MSNRANRRLRRTTLIALLGALALGALLLGACGDSSPTTVIAPATAPAPPASMTTTAASDDPVAAALALPMERLIAYDAEIELTAEQEEVKRAALTPIPAPCCSDRSAYTCCCQCNLGRAWWGLSKVLITEHGQSAAEVQANVERWIRNVRPEGFAGDSCYTGRCSTAARHDGCSGMNPRRIVS